MRIAHFQTTSESNTSRIKSLLWLDKMISLSSIQVSGTQVQILLTRHMVGIDLGEVPLVVCLTRLDSRDGMCFSTKFILAN